MVDQKLTELTEDASPAVTDITYGVKDPGGSPLSRKLQWDNILALYDSKTSTLTNKTFDANGTGNSLSNVDVADLADGTDGELITWDATGSPATVAVGTSGHVLTSNGTGAAPTFQAPGAASQTPWAQDIDADGFDLQDLSNIEFRTTTGAPAGTVQNIHADAGGININVPTGDILDVQVNAVSQMTISVSTIDFQANTLTDIADITSITNLNGVAIGDYAITTDTLDVFAATTSAELASVISDETGSGLLVFGTSPTIVTPTIASFANATHSHLNAAGGGTITAAAISDYASATATWTNKTFDANGTGNSLSNVDVADLAAGTDGELITWDAAGAPATVAVGTSGHVLTSNGAGAAPTFQAALGGSDTPWTEDHDADGFDLNDLSNLEFRATTGAPAGTVANIHADAGGININVPTGDILDVQVNTVSQMTVSVDTIDFQANTLTDIADITSITNLNGVAIGSYALATGDTYTGTHDFGGADDLEIPNSATPTVDTTGQIAFDTTITSHLGMIKIHDGTQVLLIPTIREVDLTTTDNDVIAYSSANSRFQMEAQSGAGGGDPQTPWAQDIDGDGFNLTDAGVIFLREQADADADVAGQGQIWVNTATPNELYFTDDAGNDHAIASDQETLGFFAATTSAALAGVISDETGSGALVFATSPTLVTPALGTPSSGVATNLTGTSGITGLGTQSQDLDMGTNNIDNGGVIYLNEQAEADADVAGDGQIWVDTQTPNVLFFTDDAGTDFRVSFNTSAQLAAMVTDETGSGALVFGTSPTLVTPALGTPASGVLTNCTGLPVGGLADGTDGELITWDSSGVAATVAVGTSGHVLTSNGAGAAPTFQAAGAADNLGDHTATEDLQMANFNIDAVNSIYLNEKADANADIVGDGQIWVNTATPNELYFTDDAGNDHAIASDQENLSFFSATTSAQLASVISDETGSGVLVFGTSPTLTTPTIAGATGTGVHDFGGATSFEIPNSATPTVNADGEIAIDTTITDFSAGLIKYFSGEEMAVVAMPVAELTSPTDTHVVTYNATTDEFELAAGGGGGGATDTEFPIPLVQEIGEDAVAYSDAHDLVTASAHVTGWVLPDGAATATINLKTMHPIPDDLAGTPAARIEFVIMTKGAVAGPADVRLTVSSLAVADTENFDVAFTAETETTVTMPTATETQDVYSQDMTTDPVAGDTVLVKLQRDPTDAADDFTDDIQIVSATLWIHRST